MSCFNPKYHSQKVTLRLLFCMSAARQVLTPSRGGRAKK